MYISNLISDFEANSIVEESAFISFKVTTQAVSNEVLTSWIQRNNGNTVDKGLYSIIYMNGLLVGKYEKASETLKTIEEPVLTEDVEGDDATFEYDENEPTGDYNSSWDALGSYDGEGSEENDEVEDAVELEMADEDDQELQVESYDLVAEESKFVINQLNGETSNPRWNKSGTTYDSLEEAQSQLLRYVGKKWGDNWTIANLNGNSIILTPKEGANTKDFIKYDGQLTPITEVTFKNIKEAREALDVYDTDWRNNWELTEQEATKQVEEEVDDVIQLDEESIETPNIEDVNAFLFDQYGERAQVVGDVAIFETRLEPDVTPDMYAEMITIDLGEEAEIYVTVTYEYDDDTELYAFEVALQDEVEESIDEDEEIDFDIEDIKDLVADVHNELEAEEDEEELDEENKGASSDKSFSEDSDEDEDDVSISTSKKGKSSDKSFSEDEDLNIEIEEEELTIEDEEEIRNIATDVHNNLERQENDAEGEEYIDLVYQDDEEEDVDAFEDDAEIDDDIDLEFDVVDDSADDEELDIELEDEVEEEELDIELDEEDEDIELDEEETNDVYALDDEVAEESAIIPQGFVEEEEDEDIDLDFEDDFDIDEDEDFDTEDNDDFAEDTTDLGEDTDFEDEVEADDFTETDTSDVLVANLSMGFELAMKKGWELPFGTDITSDAITDWATEVLADTDSLKETAIAFGLPLEICKDFLGDVIKHAEDLSSEISDIEVEVDEAEPTDEGEDLGDEDEADEDFGDDDELDDFDEDEDDDFGAEDEI